MSAATVARLCSLPIFSLLVCSLGQTPPLSQGIVFSGSTPPAPTTTTFGPTAPSLTTCYCSPSGPCPGSGPIIDIRIVNQGVPSACPIGEVLCCSSTPTSGNQQNLVSGCGLRKITDPSPQPTGTALYGAYPWHVAILAPNNSYIGSGVLITPNHVLTAAHRVPMTLNFKIRLGDWNGQSLNERYPYQEYRPSNIAVHPNFNSANLQSDIAVIRLQGTVPLATSPNINTACYPTAIPAVGTRCWVTGWGKNAFGPNGNYQSILKEVDVPIVDQTTCEAQLRRNTRLGHGFELERNSFICAGGEQGKDACTGDGGAPLVCRSASGAWQVVGLVAWGIGCATSAVPGVYVNVLNYLPWINQEVNIL